MSCRGLKGFPPVHMGRCGIHDSCTLWNTALFNFQRRLGILIGMSTRLLVLHTGVFSRQNTHAGRHGVSMPCAFPVMQGAAR